MLKRVRHKLADFGGWLDTLGPRMAHARWQLFWPIVYAICVGQTAFVIRHLSWIPQIETNKVPSKDSFIMTAWTAGGIVLVGLLYFGVMLARRVRSGAWRVAETAADLNKRLAPLLALPFLPVLTLPLVERDSPKQTLFYCLLASAAIGAGAYGWSRASTLGVGQAISEPALPGDAPQPERPWRERLAKVLAALSVTALWAGYGAFFSRLSIINHRALNTRTTDLGYYDNIFYQSIHGKPLGCSFIKAGYHGSAHFDPLLVVLSPLYLLYPRAEMLLVLQSVWLGAGVVPMYLLAQEKLGRRLPAVALALMYALYPALQGANMYEFHSLTLLSPIMLWLLYFLETGRFVGYWLVLVPVLLCREDASLLMCFVGLYAILSRQGRLARLGWITILVSVVYFVIVKRFFMTSADIFMGGKDSYSFAYYYEDLIPNKNGIGGLAISLFTNPVFVVKTMFAEAKLVYLATLFLPLAFLPLVVRPGRVMLIYGVLFCVLASRGAVFSTHFQYSATILPIAFALTPVALAHIEEGRALGSLGLDGARLSRGLLAAAFAASLLLSWKFGGLVENASFKGGFGRVARTLTDRDKKEYEWLSAQVASIPRRASVGTTNKLGPHVSNRKDAFFYPEKMHTQYVLLDESELKGGDLEKHNKQVEKGALELLSRHEKMALYKRVDESKKK